MQEALRPVVDRGLVLLGCGRMGGALLAGWRAAGVPPRAVTVLDPNADPRLAGEGVRVNAPPPDHPAVVVLAVKPQMMAEALPSVAHLAGNETLFLSIAAGTPIAWLEGRLAAGTPIVRAMPNTPAAVGRGITALIANAAGQRVLGLAEALASCVGETVRLEAESQIDAVTAVSGSGPAYVFHLIEALASAGESEGLSRDLAMRLARATLCGAGELAYRSAESAGALRVAVTSPGGTTAAALVELMDDRRGLGPLLRRAVAAAAARSRALAG